MKGAFSVVIYACVAALTFSTVHTIGDLLLGYRTGVDVVFPATPLPAVDGESFNQILSSSVAAVGLLITAGVHRARTNRKRDARMRAMWKESSLEAIRQGLEEANLRGAPTEELAELQRRVARIEEKVGKATTTLPEK
ncbi:MAG: hypothetical protein AB7O38_29935 [Pirellulaceae bacterium]